MSDDMNCRNNEMELLLKRYAESSYRTMNIAFFGVKGVGKTSLFQGYFTKEKRRELAGEYKKIFVLSRLDSRAKGVDLYRFLIDQVRIGTRDIPDEAVRDNIENEFLKIDKNSETQDSKLREYLNILVDDNGYDIILIMDHFHCMVRDTEVGGQQYDLLRALNEDKLFTYWIITDTDLKETHATDQYLASFFAQKFTTLYTIVPVSMEQRNNLVRTIADHKMREVTEEEKKIIADLSGGIPEIISILIDILDQVKWDGMEATKEELVQRFLLHPAGSSLFSAWKSGLTGKQKEKLFKVASLGSGITESEVTREVRVKLEELGDRVGRGLIHINRDDDGVAWTISNNLFRLYILEQGDLFYMEPDESETGLMKTDNCLQSSVQPSAQPTAPSITNVYVNGNYIQNQVTNVLRIDNAIEGLENLQKLAVGSLSNAEAQKNLQFLPFRQDAWKEISADEQEHELDKYAEGIFSSDVFSREDLTIDQMNRFNLNDEILGRLSDPCRKQIICGIKVFDLLQMCIERFGMNMSDSESPRGILLAKAFEQHLRDHAAPAYRAIPNIAALYVYPTQTPFSSYPIEKTMIGCYASILKNNLRVFCRITEREQALSNRDNRWWSVLAQNIGSIGDLRNKCCHSGIDFRNSDLQNLIRLIFDDQLIKEVLFFDDIRVFLQNQTSVNPDRGNSYPVPNRSLLGRHVRFKILRKKNPGGNFIGEVNGRFLGSLPKRYAANFQFSQVKNTEIDAVADNIQDGKYILRI